MPAKTQPCPECGTDARQIHTETVRNMLDPFTNQEVEDGPQYRVCTAQDCDIVYFTDELDQQFGTDDVRVTVNFKLDAEDRPYPLCYCFGYHKQDVISEVKDTGRSSVVEWITDRVQAEECACRWKNPSGGCCLSDVKQAVDQAENQPKQEQV